jgi:limonene-1,2-epoxide hydrolase
VQSAEELVRDFSDAFGRKDINLIFDLLADDCVYANVPLPAMVGKAAIRAFLVPSLEKADKIEFILMNIATAADGSTVLTERVDVFHYANGRASVPLMGIFLVRDGKIAEWRDYADIASFVRQMAAIGQTPGVAGGAEK